MNEDKIAAIFLLGLFLFYMSIIGRYPLMADEGTHALLSLFYRDLIKTVLTNMDFSLEKMYQFGVSYLIHYPKLQASYPPLYHLITGTVFYSIFGVNSFAARFSNLFITISTFAVFYMLVRDSFGRKIALYSLLSFCLFTTTMVYAWQVMTDFTSLFFAVLSLYIYTKAKKDDNIILYILTGLSVVLSVLGKQVGLVIIPYFLLDALFSGHGNIRRLLPLSFPIISILLLYGFLLNKFDLLAVGMQVMEMHEPTSKILSIGPLGYAHLYPILVFLAVAFILYIKQKEKDWQGMLIWFLITFPGVAFIYFIPRFFHFFLIPMYIAAGYWISKMSVKLKIVVVFLLAFNVAIFLMQALTFYPERIDNTISKYIYDNLPQNANIAMFAENNFHSSTFMFPLATMDTSKKTVFFRQCMFFNKTADEIVAQLKANNIYFILAQPNEEEGEYENIEKIRDNLTKIFGEPVELYIFNGFEGHITEKNCNYICLTGKTLCTDYESPFDVYK